METAAQRELSLETGLSARVAISDKDMDDVLELRHNVFTKTFSSQTEQTTTQSTRDIDLYDAYCKHLIVRDHTTRQAVATTRLLSDSEASMIGHFYSQGEFFLPGLLELPGRVLELGRTCIHEDYRDGSAIVSLWQALARFLTKNHYRYLIGCASIDMSDGGIQAEAIMNEIRSKHLDSSRIKAIPRRPVPNISLPENVMARMPPLLKTYLNLGAKVCGEPCWDKDFGCADVFVLLDTHELCPRYARRFHLEGWSP